MRCLFRRNFLLFRRQLPHRAAVVGQCPAWICSGHYGLCPLRYHIGKFHSRCKGEAAGIPDSGFKWRLPVHVRPGRDSGRYQMAKRIPCPVSGNSGSFGRIIGSSHGSPCKNRKENGFRPEDSRESLPDLRPFRSDVRMLLYFWSQYLNIYHYGISIRNFCAGWYRLCTPDHLRCHCRHCIRTNRDNPKKWTVPFCCLIVTVGYVASAFLTGSLAGCIIGSVLLGFGKSFVMPYAVNQVSTVSPPSKIPTCISFLMGCMNLGMFLSNYFIGFLAGFSGEITVFSQFSVCAVLSVAAAVLAFFLYTAEKPANTQSSI